MKKLTEFKIGSISPKVGSNPSVVTYRNVAKNGQWEQAVIKFDESGEMYFFDKDTCKRVYIA
jgi:hypothetical protein